MVSGPAELVDEGARERIDKMAQSISVRTNIVPRPRRAARDIGSGPSASTDSAAAG